MNNGTDPKNRQQREVRHAWHTPVRARVALPRVKTTDPIEHKLVDMMTLRYLCGRARPCPGKLGGTFPSRENAPEVLSAVYPPRGLSFYGYADTGYRLSDGRNAHHRCDTSGRTTVGRRLLNGGKPTPAQEVRVDSGDVLRLPAQPPTRVAVSKSIEAPCLVWCPRCGTLNEIVPPTSNEVGTLL